MKKEAGEKIANLGHWVRAALDPPLPTLEIQSAKAAVFALECAMNHEDRIEALEVVRSMDRPVIPIRPVRPSRLLDELIAAARGVIWAYNRELPMGKKVSVLQEVLEPFKDREVS